jgi:hypothetical protein
MALLLGWGWQWTILVTADAPLTIAPYADPEGRASLLEAYAYNNIIDLLLIIM